MTDVAQEAGEASLASKALFAAGIGAVAIGRVVEQWKDSSDDRPELEP